MARTLIHVPERASTGDIVEIRVTIAHPMETGHRRGSDGGRWHPADGVRPAGEVVDSLQALLRAALLL